MEKRKKKVAKNIFDIVRGNSTVLSYGCGLGYIENLLLKKGVNLHAFDFSSISLKWLLINHNKKVKTELTNEKYDYIFFNQVLYSMDMNDHDTLIAHTNGQAIREANGVESKAVKLTKEEVEKMTANDEEDKPKSTRRNKQIDLEDSIEEVESKEEVVVDEDDDVTFELD